MVISDADAQARDDFSWIELIAVVACWDRIMGLVEYS